MTYGILLIVLGLLAAPKLVLGKVPSLDGLVNLLQKVESFIGLFAIIWGAWSTIQCVINIGLMSSNMLWWLTWLVGAIVLLLLGILLGLNLLIGNLISTVKGTAILLVLKPYKQALAIMALLLGILTIVLHNI